MIRLLNDNVLLDEILEDPDVQAYKDRLLQDCLQQLRPQRRMRLWMTTAASAAVILILVSFWLSRAPVSPIDPPDVTPAYLIKAGAPIDPSIYLATNPAILEGKLISAPPQFANLVQSHPLPADLFVRQTLPVQYITDSEMLALFPGTPCGFIRPEKGPAQFVFLDPEAAKRYLR